MCFGEAQMTAAQEPHGPKMWPHLCGSFQCIGGAVILHLRDQKRETHKRRKTHLLFSAFPFCVPRKALGCVFIWCKSAGCTSPRSWALLRFTYNLQTNWGLTRLSVWACAAYICMCLYLRMYILININMSQLAFIFYRHSSPHLPPNFRISMSSVFVKALSPQAGSACGDLCAPCTQREPESCGLSPKHVLAHWAE